MLPARLARSWAEMVPCGGAGAGGASGLALADAGGEEVPAANQERSPSLAGTGGAGTLLTASPASAAPIASDAADVAAPPASIAPAVSVSCKSATHSGASSTCSDSSSYGRSPKSDAFSNLRCHSNEVPTAHPQSPRSDRTRHLGDHPRCKRKEKH